MIKQLSSQGRFLKFDSDKNLWIEIYYKAAIDKASQALREKKSPRQLTNLSRINN